MRKRSGFFAYWPSQIKVFIIFLILVASGILLAVADYGESSDSLGQITDEFTSLDNVSVRVQIERNVTLNAMELNFTLSGSPIAENYSLYTEVDANNRFTVTDTTITVNSLRNTDDHHYIVFDYGGGYFTDFTHDLEARGRDDSGVSGNDRMFVWLLSNSSDEAAQMINNGDELIGLFFQEFDNGDPNDPEISLREYEDTALFLDKFEPASRDVWYYFRIIKTGTDLKVGIYSSAVLRDAGNATDGNIDNLALTLHGDYNFRYIYAVSGLNTGTPTIRIISGDIANLTIGRSSSGYLSDGYFTTNDHLSGINGSVLVQLTNATIPAGTGITAEFSSDNSTWLNPTALIAGFQAIDLRDLNWSTAHFVRYNFTSPSEIATPRLYQSRLITTEGQAGATVPGAPGMNVSRETVLYNLTEIGVTVGTLDSGNLNSTLDIDGNTYNVSELVGAPGMVISGNFSGVDPDAGCLWVVIYAFYDGSLSHDFDVELWNFTGSAWVEDSHIPDMTDFEWVNSTIYELRDPSDFLSGGAVRVRLDHEAAGNINHDIFIEYFKLLAEIPGGLAVGAGAVTIIESDAPWIAIAIILMCIAYLLLRSR